jgi:hypothetical protein
MPNIIQQQDLLKGLPDDRLSMLMQNPTGDIPPFLVAAEAQRRQSIREQFSGGPQESVVDTLTKQLAGVPQNIQAPMQEPPQMPPPQMQAGVGALQQTARDGGLMRRFASDGYVDPLGAPDPGSEYLPYVPDLSPVTGFFTETIPNFASGVGDYVSRFAQDLPNSPFPSWPTAEERRDKLAEEAMLSAPESSRDIQAQKRYAEMLNRPEVVVDNSKVTIPRDPNASKNGTSPENLKAPAVDEIRKRLEALYGDGELSGAEKAEKWFAMSKVFFTPGQSFGESLANAGLEYSRAAGEESRAARAERIAREKGLLEYDIAKISEENKRLEDMQARIDAEQRARAEYAADRQSGITTERNRLYERIEDVNKAVRDGILTPEEGNARILMLQSQIDELGTIQGGMDDFLSKYYQINAIPSVDTASRSVVPPAR